MERKDIIIIVAVLAVMGFSIYRRYMKRNQEKSKPGSGKKTGSSFSSPSIDDDYEPYSKK